MCLQQLTIKCEPLTASKFVGCAHTRHSSLCVAYQHRHVHTASKMKPRSKDLSTDMNALIYSVLESQVTDLQHWSKNKYRYADSDS